MWTELNENDPMPKKDVYSIRAFGQEMENYYPNGTGFHRIVAHPTDPARVDRADVTHYRYDMTLEEHSETI